MSKRKVNAAGIAFPIGALAALWVLGHSGVLPSIPGAAFVLALVGAATALLVAVLRALRGPAGRSRPPPDHERIPPRLGLDEANPDPGRDLPGTRTPLPPAEWSVGLIESLEWKRFEGLCAAYFAARGHEVTMTGDGADGGVDFFLRGYADSSKPLGVVQCKAWGKKPIGVREIRELLGIMTDAGCPLGIFVTTSSYTVEAEQFAAGKHIKLLNADRLLELIESLPEEVQADLLARITDGDYTTPSCPSCGIKLVLRTAKKGTGRGRQFWGCANFQKGCRYTMPARSDTTASQAHSGDRASGAF